MAITKETAREKGRRGGEASAAARKAKAALKPEQLARLKFSGEAEKLADVMLAAALGTGEFHSLDPKERMQAAKLCLEYAVGRPKQMAPDAPDADEAEAPKTGLAFRVGEKPPDSEVFPVGEDS